MPSELVSRRGFQPRYPEPDLNIVDSIGNEAGSLVYGGAFETVKLRNPTGINH